MLMPIISAHTTAVHAECELTGDEGADPSATLDKPPAHVISGPTGGWHNPLPNRFERLLQLFTPNIAE